jgi:hypothetical protein
VETRRAARSALFFFARFEWSDALDFERMRPSILVAKRYVFVFYESMRLKAKSRLLVVVSLCVIVDLPRSPFRPTGMMDKHAMTIVLPRPESPGAALALERPPGLGVQIAGCVERRDNVVSPFSASLRKVRASREMKDNVLKHMRLPYLEDAFI